MKSKLSVYLSQPAPVNNRPWLSVAMFTLIVVLILAIFQPFNFSLKNARQLWVLLGFALISSFGSFLVFVLFPKLCRRLYEPEKWTVRKNLLNNLLLLIIVGIGVVSFNYFILIKPRPDNYFLIVLVDLFATVTVGIIPLSILTFVIQTRALKQNLQAAEEINKKLSERIPVGSTDGNTITLSGSTKETITVNPEYICYLEAAGNYIDVHYVQDDKHMHKLLRSTIKHMEESLGAYPMFIRCHRAFIVNRNRITSISGNAQGDKLLFDKVDQTVPVSRTYMKDLKRSFG